MRGHPEGSGFATRRGASEVGGFPFEFAHFNRHYRTNEIRCNYLKIIICATRDPSLPPGGDESPNRQQGK
jgi:hypothetical protein